MGINGRFSLDDYKPNSIQQWCSFKSTSKDIRVAYEFSYNDCTKYNQNPELWQGEFLIFKIFVSKENKVPSTVELIGGDFSCYPREKEVLLLPFFTFRVIDIVQTNERVCEMPESNKIVRGKVTVITVMEIPF
jgi:hypothetical protein